jgi:hypothetical protein
MQRGEGYLWAPGRGVLDGVAFSPIRTFDSSRTPKRVERLATPRTLAEVDLTGIVAALAAETDHPRKPDRDQRSRPAADRRHLAQLEEQLDLANARFAGLEQENRELKSRLAGVAALCRRLDLRTHRSRTTPAKTTTAAQKLRRLP